MNIGDVMLANLRISRPCTKLLLSTPTNPRHTRPAAGAPAPGARPVMTPARPRPDAQRASLLQQLQDPAIPMPLRARLTASYQRERRGLDVAHGRKLREHIAAQTAYRRMLETYNRLQIVGSSDRFLDCIYNIELRIGIDEVERREEAWRQILDRPGYASLRRAISARTGWSQKSLPKSHCAASL